MHVWSVKRNQKDEFGGKKSAAGGAGTAFGALRGEAKVQAAGRKEWLSVAGTVPT